MSTAPYLRNLRKAELTELAEVSDLKEYVFAHGLGGQEEGKKEKT